MRYENQELLVMVERNNAGAARIVATVGIGASIASTEWCDVLPAGQESPAGPGLHVWRGWIDIEPTYPVLVEQADDEGSWRRCTAEDLERFGMPLCEEVMADVVEEPNAREGKWCYQLPGDDEDMWHGFFETRAEAINYVAKHFSAALLDSETKYGQAKVFHPSQEFDASEIAEELRHQVWQAAMAKAGEAADDYLAKLDCADVGERLAEAIRVELCRPEWNFKGFWVEEETSVEEASERELLGGL